eukprot:scaffold388_cov111-Isochrysis_galbana.AAC.7
MEMEKTADATTARAATARGGGRASSNVKRTRSCTHGPQRARGARKPCADFEDFCKHTHILYE